jgi:ABC-type transporter Mla subunit MlaD
VFLADRIELTPQLRFEVLFAHAGSVRAGAPVVVAGRTIGEVEAITPVPRGTPGPLGGAPGVAARIRIDASAAWMIDAAGEFFVSSRGPLAERFLEVGPQPCARRPATRPRECTATSVVPARPIRAGEQVRGVDPPSMDRVLQRTWDNLQVTRRFVDEVRPELDELLARLDELARTIEAVEPAPGEWSRLAREVGELIAAARTTWTDVVGGEAGADRIRATLASARAVMARAGTRLGELDARWQALAGALAAAQDRIAAHGEPALARLAAAIERARAAMDRLEPLRAKVRDLADRIARGEGSIGKLMKDPEFPEDAKELGRILKRQPWKIIGHPPDDLDTGGRAP